MILSLLAVSCNKEEPSKNQVTGEPEVFEVKLGLVGAITSEMGPLTKDGEIDQLIGINVWSCPENGNKYSCYAYGLFDINDISVKLLTGYKYKFNARAVLEDREKVRSKYSETFRGPFMIHNGVLGGSWSTDGSTLDNTMLYSAERYFTDECDYDAFAPVDLYYGETGEYSPVEGGQVTIDMERVSFGLRIAVQNFSNGVVTVKIPEFAEEKEIAIEYPSSQYYSIRAMNRYGLSYTYSDYTENITVSAQLTDENDVTTSLGSATVTIKKNKLIKININATPPSETNGVTFNYANESLIDNSDDTYNIGGGENIETPIN